MSSIHTVSRLVLGLSLVFGLLSPASTQELTIRWFQWGPAENLQKLADRYYEETGVKVTVETYPESDFKQWVFKGWRAGDHFDLVVGDWRWLDQAAQGGFYSELTEFYDQHNLQEVMVPASLRYGDFPTVSGRFWAIPLYGNAIGWS
jgi:multiple sugar transport system substrate-binding protein